MKPVRTFTADEGDYSTGLAGPNAIEADIDAINKALNPSISGGGLQTENMNAGIATDTVIGNRTADQAIATATANTGTLTQLFSWIAKLIKGITGQADWKTAPVKSIETLNTELLAEVNIRDMTYTVLQNNIDQKAPIANPTFTGTVSGVSKAMVGLGNVDNTSDADKPISALTQTALNAKASTTALEVHKTSDDHDGQYISKTNADVYLPNNPYEPATKRYVDDTLAGAVLGAVPDDSLENAKFAADVKLGSLTALSSLLDGFKTSLSAALNKVVEWVGDVSTLSTAVKTSVVDSINWIFNNTPKQTTADITYYVRTDGSDSNTGLSDTSGGAFLTIQHAINMIPQIVNHTVTINVAAGTYAESILAIGFSGKGTIDIVGDSVASTSRTIVSAAFYKCGLAVSITGFNGTKTGGDVFIASESIYVTFNYCQTTATDATYYGVRVQSSKALVIRCVLSNRGSAICASTLADIRTSNNTGTGNLYGMRSQYGGRICKYGTNPVGTVAHELTQYGGTITNDDGTPGGEVRGQQVLSVARTLYVRTDGNDSNDGLTNSAAGAFLTIQAAIDSLPKRLDADVVVNVDAGTYAENITIEGFVGGGTLDILGDTVTSTTRTVNRFTITGCSNEQVYVRGFNCTTTTANAFEVSGVVYLVILSCKAIGADATNSGVFAYASNVYTTTCEFSNKEVGIYASYMSNISVNTTSGSGNTYAFRALRGGTIGKYSSNTITGTTQDSTTGGLIVPAETDSGILQSSTGTALPATSGTMTVTMDGSIKTLTPAGSCTLNADSSGKDGDRFSLRINTTTASRGITFGTNFKSQGAITTGATTGLFFLISFVKSGSTWYETGRTVAM